MRNWRRQQHPPPRLTAAPVQPPHMYVILSGEDGSGGSGAKHGGRRFVFCSSFDYRLVNSWSCAARLSWRTARSSGSSLTKHATSPVSKVSGVRRSSSPAPPPPHGSPPQEFAGCRRRRHKHVGPHFAFFRTVLSHPLAAACLIHRGNLTLALLHLNTA
ncbi:hypothetical protein LX36DRAFT_43567 [Colletotrichum falcatum]|nr:hypothetical protein LX36DRAFT_43567 [Colletotrichum falcatum]